MVLLLLALFAATASDLGQDGANSRNDSDSVNSKTAIATAAATAMV